jgi:hypothetical protein
MELVKETISPLGPMLKEKANMNSIFPRRHHNWRLFRFLHYFLFEGPRYDANKWNEEALRLAGPKPKGEFRRTALSARAPHQEIRKFVWPTRERRSVCPIRPQSKSEQLMK